MPTRLPADWMSRSRLEGIYKLQIAHLFDCSRPRYNADKVTTVAGSAARLMPQDEVEDDTGTTSAKRLLKMVLADQAERLLIAYEYEKWEHLHGETGGLGVGDMIELHGPILMMQGVAMLTGKNIKTINSAVPVSTTTTSVPSSMPAPIIVEHPDWMHDLPSDLFTLSQEDNDVIVIDD